MTQMQGIVSILRSDNPEKTNKAASLRRTLSADMSSKRWLTDNLSPAPAMKKIASFEQIAVDNSNSGSNLSDSDEEECGVVRKCDESPTRMDIWSAIMSQKKDQDSGQLPPPYVHPLVKKSASSLSEKSLKVCTESLGSETGSDVFSSDSSSDSDEEQKQHSSDEQNSEEQKVVKIAAFPAKKQNPPPPAAGRSFPPPLLSLAAARTDGPSLHMHSRRVDGRLVLEAVCVPQQKYFEAQRHDGRFLLTLIDKENHPENNEFPDKLKTEEAGILKNRRTNSTGVFVNAHKSTVTIKKLTKRVEKNTKISNNLSKLEAVDEEESAALPPPVPRITKGLPPLPPPSPATTVNSYQYFWKEKQTVASVIDPTITQHQPPPKSKDMVLFRDNKADCFLPSLKGCKEPRRPNMMWESLCIATS